MAATQEMAGQVAIVTGSASGIGRASALAFARAGARVVVQLQPVRGRGARDSGPGARRRERGAGDPDQRRQRGGS